MDGERNGGAPTQSTDATSTNKFSGTHTTPQPGGDKQSAITDAKGERN